VHLHAGKDTFRFGIVALSLKGYKVTCKIIDPLYISCGRRFKICLHCCLCTTSTQASELVFLFENDIGCCCNNCHCIQPFAQWFVLCCVVCLLFVCFCLVSWWTSKTAPCLSLVGRVVVLCISPEMHDGQWESIFGWNGKDNYY
jgi:hypothetical protein